MTYFVSYFGTAKNGGQFQGRSSVIRSLPVTSLQDVADMEAALRKDNGAKQLVILNWQPFEISEPSPSDRLEFRPDAEGVHHHKD